MVYLDEAGVAQSLPAPWTSAFATDPAVALSGGRSVFRVADLLELAKLVREVRPDEPASGGSATCGGA